MPPIPQDMTHYTLPEADFWGKFLAEADTDNGRNPRWAQLQLYAIIDTNPAHKEFGTGMWLLYTTGHSLVVHALDGCGLGLLARAREFGNITSEDPDDLVACTICHPGNFRDNPDKEYSLEVPRHTSIPCRSAEKVIRSLCREISCETCKHPAHASKDCPRCGCGEFTPDQPVLSGPGRQLVEKARRLDPEIDRAATEMLVRKF
jgi:hypothetical protein